MAGSVKYVHRPVLVSGCERDGCVGLGAADSTAAAGRGLHSSIFWLNVSAFCGIGGAFRGCLVGVSKLLRIISGCSG